MRDQKGMVTEGMRKADCEEEPDVGVNGIFYRQHLDEVGME